MSRTRLRGSCRKATEGVRQILREIHLPGLRKVRTSQRLSSCFQVNSCPSVVAACSFQPQPLLSRPCWRAPTPELRR
jgi:hypothetical protein